MKIYTFKYKSGSVDWVFAPDIESAKEFYLDFTGCGGLEGYEITELHKSKWKETYVLDPNELEPESDEENYNEGEYASGLKIVETLAEYAERNTIIDMIATTEF